MATILRDTLDDGLRELALRLGTRLGDEFVNEAQNNASRRTGEMADSVAADPPEFTGESVVVHVAVGAEHGIYQDQGTGIYGPEGVPITPRSARVLRFDSPILGLVFAHSVRGSEPTRWWTKAVDAWRQIVMRVSIGG